MNFGTIGENAPLIVVIIVLILLQFFFWRRRKPEATREEITRSLLSEVRLNQALGETFRLRQKPKKFEAASWQINKTRLDFLSQSLQVALSDAFGMVEDFNRQIDVAKKHKSPSYVASLDVDKIKEPLAKSKQGLEEWLLAKTGGKEPPPKYPGLLDGLFGWRR